MILKQYYLGCLAHASYLIGDEASGKAVVVDPRRDVDEYIAEAETLGLSIDHVVLTHFHADFLAGHLELQARTGATIHLGHAAQAEYAFEAVGDGTVWDWDSVRIEFLETPGHTPESVSLVVYDKQAGTGAPHAVLTGDTLFNGDVGRPDLLASIGVTEEELASLLYDSLQDKLLTLPDETLVYPAHGAGSLCGKNLQGEAVTTIGAQKRSNAALRPIGKEAFMAFVTTDQPAAPKYFVHDAVLNRKERPTLDETLQGLEPVDIDTLLARANQGVQLVDTRDDEAFQAEHLDGSVNIGLDGTYATWCGSVLDPERPILLIAEPGKQEESAVRLGRIGYEKIEGFLDGGFATVRAERPDRVQSVVRLDAAAFGRHMRADEPPVVLDVRSAGERESAWIGDSLHIPLSELVDRMDEVPRDREVVVHCAGGYRSSLAVSLLRRDGHRNVADLRGGIQTALQRLDAPVRTRMGGVLQVRPGDAQNMVRQGAHLIDVRETYEWHEARLPEAVHQPMSSIQQWWQDVPRDRPVILQCRSGNRSQQVAQALAQQGFDNVVNLQGGIMGWHSAGLPLLTEAE